MQKEPYILELDHWIIRVREPESTGSYPVILLLHGWTGDENAMWVFANRLPRNSLLISPPRALSCSAERIWLAPRFI